MKTLLASIFVILFFGCKPGPSVPDKSTKGEAWRFFWSVNWHPNQPQISVGGSIDTLQFFSTADYKLTKSYPYPGTITKTKWHPSKNRLAISVQDGKSKSSILDLDKDRQITLDSISDDGARAIGWNQSGDLLAVGDYEGFITVFDENGKFLRKIDTKQKSIIGLDWHPTENLIVAVGDYITWYHYEMDSLKNIEDREKDVLMLCVDWHPSGTFFVTGDYGDFEYHYPPLLQFWSYDGLNTKSIEESKAEYRNIKWSADGRLLATASEKIRLWNQEGTVVAAKKTQGLVWGIDWSNDDVTIVTSDEKGSIVFWDSKLERLKEL